ncbi:MAG: ATP-binding cassette domain-containing protein, partial [Candidatus Margulisiibacteriota bacterium]
MLEINQVSKYFEGLKALENVNFVVNEQEITALIGPNGAGKTTLFNVLMGLYPVTSGQMTYQKQSLNNLKPFEINQKGIARTFQNLRLFPHMTVLENVLVGAYSRTHYGFLDAIFQTRRYQ